MAWRACALSHAISHIVAGHLLLYIRCFRLCWARLGLCTWIHAVNQSAMQGLQDLDLEHA